MRFPLSAMRHLLARFWRPLRVPASLFGVLLLLGTAPVGHPDPPTETARAINTFTFDFLRQVPPALLEKNNVLSPQSIFHGYAMSLAGSAGETRAELAKAFHFPDDENLLLEQLTAIRSQVKNDPAAKSVLLNAAWIGGVTKFRQDYKERLALAFEAALFDDTFADPEGSSAAINRWIADNTAGHITEAVTPHDLRTEFPAPNVMIHPALVLVNVAYFQSEWASRFEPGATALRPFHINPAESSPVPMMAQYNTFSYAGDAEFQYVELPYKDETFSLGALLPRENIPIQQLLARIDADRLHALRASAYPHQVDLLLPKFEMRTSLELPEVLEDMGVVSAFDRAKADFTRMFIRTDMARNIFLRDSRQQAWIKTDEQGSKAAAATVSTHVSIGCATLSPASPPVSFHADHPFAFFIFHKESRTILFAGWYAAPGE